MGAFDVRSRQVAPSSVAYLYGDLFMVDRSRKGPGTAYEVEASGVKVPEGPFSTELITIALWALQDAGAVRIEGHEHRMLGLALSRRVRIIRTTPPGEQPVHNGLEAIFMRRLASAKAAEKGEELSALIRDLIPTKHQRPHSVVFRIIKKDLAALGLETPVEFEFQRMWGLRSSEKAVAYQPVMERIHELEPDARALAQAWLTFRRKEPALVDLIINRLEETLGSRMVDDPSSLTNKTWDGLT
ncbi:hypothetical protein OU415_15300 [Saccharopolyspora sp. WRP15-2]|uniref:GPP34 family phosphoprotein n=1 Tax=Saccharopolyspora oryzae TaxID=2997343 RepID=A0ABT4UYQ0_9PSEU|nr:hypothetical protein [Saccharopolyspora oryzae]MDA3626810.1 hypothetical protein [Saccharopolyspora oryzae]